MIDAQRIALLREEFGYHAEIAFARAESGPYGRQKAEHPWAPTPSPAQPESPGKTTPEHYAPA